MLDATPESRGFWTVHILPTAEGLRGFQVGIDRSGILVVEPSFWRAEGAEGDPRIGPVIARAFRRGNRLNALTLRVKGRQVEMLVNSARVGPVVTFG